MLLAGDDIGVLIRRFGENERFIPKEYLPSVGDVMCLQLNEKNVVELQPPIYSIFSNCNNVCIFRAIVFVQSLKDVHVDANILDLKLKCRISMKKINLLINGYFRSNIVEIIGKNIYINDITNIIKKFYFDYNYNHMHSFESNGFISDIKIQTAQTKCELLDIEWKMGPSTNNIKIDANDVEFQPYLESFDKAQVIIKPDKPIVMSTFEQCKQFGRFATMIKKRVVMLGKVVTSL